MPPRVIKMYKVPNCRLIFQRQLPAWFNQPTIYAFQVSYHYCLFPLGFLLFLLYSAFFFLFFPLDAHIKGKNKNENKNKPLSHFLPYVIYSQEIKLHFYKPVLPQMIAEDLLKKLIPDPLLWRVLASTALTLSFKTRWKQSNGMINFLVPAISYCSACPRFQDWPPASLQNAQLLSLINHMNTFLITVIYYLLHTQWG